jgi:membrane protein involved in colicin uptake
MHVVRNVGVARERLHRPVAAEAVVTAEVTAATKPHAAAAKAAAAGAAPAAKAAAAEAADKAEGIPGRRGRASHSGALLARHGIGSDDGGDSGGNGGGGRVARLLFDG